MTRRAWIVTWAIWAACFLLGFLVGRADGATITGDGAAGYQRWIDEARVPTPPGQLTIVATGTVGCPSRIGEVEEVAACTAPWEGLIWMGGSVANSRGVFFHEVGHNVDDDLMTDADRVAFAAIYGLGGQPWATGLDPALPGEVFASVWAECAMKPYLTQRQMHSLGKGPIFGGPPIGGRVRHNRACRLIAAL